MSESQRPPLLTMLAILALVVGVFSLIRGGLLIFGGISQVIAGVGGVFEIIIGILSLGVATLALMGGILVFREKTGGIASMKLYAATLAAYNLIWVIYSIASGGRVSWYSVVSEFLIAGATIWILMTNEEVASHSDSIG
ncbi:MAG: hypothetical protein E4G96_10090 [Chrysiogenales bacterium]|nr:MAG: hypothetical protein E4G96_10090 [Chrysiogenales bacterium]